MDNSYTHDLQISSLGLQSFRKYDTFKLHNIGKLSIFVGENAIGKTSIIEAIQLVTELKSFRATSAQQLITWNKEEASLRAVLSDGIRELEETLIIKDSHRNYYLNGKHKRIQELKGLLPAVTFTPDDLELIKGSHSKRRDSIDNIGVQLSKNFYMVRSDYQKLLKQKNQALKDEAPTAFIESINDVLAKVGSQYIFHRLTLLQAFTTIFEDAFKHITHGAERTRISYHFSWGSQQEDYDQFNKEDLMSNFQLALAKNLEDERALKRSKIGPHADQLNIYIATANNNAPYKEAIHYASQGQQRSLVLAFKMAELRTIQALIHQQPVLLLDDVMSELDENRLRMFMEMVDSGIQTFITTTNLGYFEDDIISRAQVYKLPLEGADV